jgi:CBS domain-containing membrane protein
MSIRIEDYDIIYKYNLVSLLVSFGHFSPPILIRCMNMIRETTVREGSVEQRVASAWKSLGADHTLPAVGGSLAITSVLGVSRHFVGLDQAGLLVASMGASAVLLFGVPEGPLSRPWSVFGGHVLSALVGVSCAAFIPNATSAAALSVGLAILLMSLCRCTHPPGGATALSAVIGGPAIQHMGIQYVFTPVLLNVSVMLLVAWVFHLPTARYPLRRPAPERAPVPIPTAEEFDSGVPHVVRRRTWGRAGQLFLRHTRALRRGGQPQQLD